MTFKKLALASAIAMLPMGAMAVDVLDDDSLSGVTGQDGIQITMDLNLNTNVLVHDIDGFPAVDATYDDAGAIIMTGVGFVSGAGGIVVQIDAGDSFQSGNDETTPVLNIAVSIPNGTVITTGDLDVGNSNRDGAAPAWGAEAGTAVGANQAVPTTIIDSATITLNSTDLNIQLGNEPQGYMILLDTVMTGGLTVTGMTLNDINSGGSIGAGAITVKNNGDADLNITAGVDVEPTGLVVDITAFGDAGGADIRMERVYLGSPDIFGAGTSYVGDLEVQGLTLTGQVTISGK